MLIYEKNSKLFFKSVRHASEKFKISHQSVYLCLKNKRTFYKDKADLDFVRVPLKNIALKKS